MSYIVKYICRYDFYKPYSLYFIEVVRIIEEVLEIPSASLDSYGLFTHLRLYDVEIKLFSYHLGVG